MTRITGTLHTGQYTFMIISLSILLRMRDVSELLRKSKHTFYVQYLPTLTLKIMPFMRRCGRIFRAGQATGYSMMHVHCMLGN
jgi:hypothetical protein